MESTHHSWLKIVKCLGSPWWVFCLYWTSQCLLCCMYRSLSACARAVTKLIRSKQRLQKTSIMVLDGSKRFFTTLYEYSIWLTHTVSPSLTICRFHSVFGSLNLTTVRLSGVGNSFQKHTDAESKGIKAHFNMDESGVLLLDRVSWAVFWSERFHFVLGWVIW